MPMYTSGSVGMKVLNIEGQAIYLFEPQSGECSHAVLFSHATGVAALSYAHVLTAWAERMNVRIYAYDALGHGASSDNGNTTLQTRPDDIGKELCNRLKRTFQSLQSHSVASWSLAGHSLGAWLSLYTAHELGVRHLLLWDIPLLPVSSALIWASACLLNKRSIHPLARVARRRKRTFNNFHQALNTFKRNHFFRGWQEDHIRAYIEANFNTQDDGSLILRHSPEWEAQLFESQPTLHTPLFLRMNSKERRDLKIDLIAGERSTVCHAGSVRYFSRFFPRLRWMIVPEAGHMFPFENTDGLMQTLRLSFPAHSHSTLNDIELKAG